MNAAHPTAPPAYQPYRWAGVDFTIGLRPVRNSDWIQFSPRHADNMREKRSRLSAQRERYYRTLPESLPAQRELRDLVVAHLVTDHANRYTLTGATLTSRHESLAWQLDDPHIEAVIVASRLADRPTRRLWAVAVAGSVGAAGEAVADHLLRPVTRGRT